MEFSRYRLVIEAVKSIESAAATANHPASPAFLHYLGWIGADSTGPEVPVGG
jgi:hypothetical protein